MYYEILLSCPGVQTIRLRRAELLSILGKCAHRQLLTMSMGHLYTQKLDQVYSVLIHLFQNDLQGRCHYELLGRQFIFSPYEFQNILLAKLDYLYLICQESLICLPSKIVHMSKQSRMEVIECQNKGIMYGMCLSLHLIPQTFFKKSVGSII